MRSNFLQSLLENKGASTIVPNSLEVLLRSIQKSHRLRDHKKQNFAFFIDISNFYGDPNINCDGRRRGRKIDSKAKNSVR